MHVFSGFLGMVGVTSVLYALFILNLLSRKLGAVTKTPPYFRGYYVAAALVLLAWLVRLLATSYLENQEVLAWVQHPAFALLGYHLPLALGLTLGLGVAWRYWSWLLKE